jgi:hypothetical protein
MDFNFTLPHPKGAINVSVTGATPQAAVVSIQMGCEIAALMGGVVEQAPEAIEPERTTEEKQAQAAMPELASEQPAEEPGEPDQPMVDTAGTVFDPELHTGTLNQNGTWRLKKGAKAKADEGNADAPAEVSTETTPNGATTAESETPDEPANLSMSTASDKELAEISDTELQRYCGRLAQHFGGSEGVFALAAKHVPDGEMPRPTAIKDQAARQAFIKEAQEQTGVRFHG